jgi:inosose dehydratase
MKMSSFKERIAAAPISWGVWEANGASGWTLPVDTYLSQVKELGLKATELGPDGYLPIEPVACKAKLDEYGLTAIGAFVPVMLFDADHDPLPEVERILDSYVQIGASIINYAALSGGQGYDDRPVLSEAQWDIFFENLARLVAAARERGIMPSLHHHMGTMIQTMADIELLFKRSDIGLCFDTGHATVAGISPFDLVDQYSDRINFCHLKDVNNGLAQKVQSGEMSYMEALPQGMFVPLGRGEARIADIVNTLESRGYEGWYVMEQDTVLESEADLPGAFADVQSCLDYLKSL